MSPRRILTLASLLALTGVITAATSTASGTARSPTGFKPVIGKPIASPARPVAGKPFTVSFKVTRSDTRTPLLRGTMICDPSVAGKVIRHAESFRAGTARLSFVVPADAQSKLLKVKVTIKAGGKSATRVATFGVQALPKPSLTIADASTAEGNGGTTLSFPVTLSAASTQTVTVGYATSDGTATAPGDYTAASGTLSFGPGETSKPITVTVVGDTAVEQDETFTVTLASPVNATVADGSATGTITNDDIAPRSGHYAGTTSQGKPFGFDVATDLTSLSNVSTFVDISCQEFPVSEQNLPLSMAPGYKIAIAPDWSFTDTDSYSDADGSIVVVLGGKLSAPGSAAGTLRVDMALNTDMGVVHCSTGDVTWNAS
jgi:hypothetical protein